MFGFFTNNKPEIQRQISIAINEEAERLKSIKTDIFSKLDNNEEIDLMYELDLIGNNNKEIYNKNECFVEKVSSREMFQALNMICANAQYDVNNDSATGIVKGNNIFLMRHKGYKYHFVSISATHLNMKKYVNQCIDEYNSSKEMEDIPDFIKEDMR